MAKELLRQSSWRFLNIHLTRMFGSNPSILLSELIDADERFEGKDFYLTYEYFEKRYNWSPHIQKKAYAVLQFFDLIEVSFRGIPPKNMIKINTKNIEIVGWMAKTDFNGPVGNIQLREIEKYINSYLLKPSIDTEYQIVKTTEFIRSYLLTPSIVILYKEKNNNTIINKENKKETSPSISIKSNILQYQQWIDFINTEFGTKKTLTKSLKEKIDTFLKWKYFDIRNEKEERENKFCSIEDLIKATKTAKGYFPHDGTGDEQKYIRLKNPLFMLQKKTFTKWINTSIVKTENIDELEEIFKDLWKEIFGKYENNIKEEWNKLSDEEKILAAEKIPDYYELKRGSDSKYWKGARGYLADKTFLSDFEKLKKLTQIENTVVKSVSFMDLIKKQTSDKWGLKIFQHIYNYTNVSTKSIVDNIQEIIDGPIAKKMDYQMNRLLLVKLNPTINDPYSLEKVVKPTEEKIKLFKESEIGKNTAVELIGQHISKSNKILYGNEKMSINWVKEVLAGKS